MPITYTIKKEKGVVVSKHEGVVSDKELLDTYRRLYNDPDFQLEFKKLVDLRATESLERSADALQDIAQMIKSRYAGSSARSKTAIVAPRDLSYGLARIYEVYSEDTPQETAVFRDLEKALDWLELSADILDAQMPAT